MEYENNCFQFHANEPLDEREARDCRSLPRIASLRKACRGS
jgi:hypothetical protein